MNIFVDQAYDYFPLKQHNLYISFPFTKSFPHLQMASKTAEAGTLTEPESLGPCEPGTNINLDGIVWNETKGGELE